MSINIFLRILFKNLLLRSGRNSIKPLLLSLTLMDARRIKRLQELIDYVNQHSRELRYVSLERFAREHGVSYETVKKDLAVLAYASIPGPEGFNLKYVPRTYRKEVRQLWSMMGIKGQGPGVIDHRTAQRAASIFLLHTPKIDVERFSMVGPQTPEIRRMQAEFAKSIEEVVEAVKDLRVHPARAYLDAWRIAGVKLHEEIERVMRESGGDVREVERVWRSNLYKLRAAVEYESFRSEYMKLLQREHKVSGRKTLAGQSLPVSLPVMMEERGVPARTAEDADRVWQRLLSDIKNMRRWYRPGGRNPLPRNIKKQVERWFLSLSPEERMRALSSEDPFIRFMARSALRLKNADRLYAKAKEIEEGTVLGRKRKRR